MEWLSSFLAWVWERHTNILSWYVRPLFIIPFCYFAYRRSWKGILFTLLLFPTSLFWFPAPANPSQEVVGYLEWERQFVTGGDTVAKAILCMLVVAFFYLLGAAFWKRNWIWGLAVLNAATLMKVVWSVAFGGAVGWATLAPAIVTLAVCDTIILAVVKLRARKKAVG